MQGPSSAKATSASFGLRHRTARGTGMPAGASTRALATCSIKFIAQPPLRRVADPLPVRPEQFLFARLVLGDRRDEVGDVQHVPVAQVFGDRVLLPGAAAHAEGEAEAGVEAAAIAEGVGEVHQHPHDVEVFRQFAGAVHVGAVQAAGMALALVFEDLAHTLLRRREVAGA